MPIGPDDDVDVEAGDEESVFPDLLFCENETNFQRLYGGQNESGYAKDAIHDHVIPEHRPKVEGGVYFGKIHSATAVEDEDEECGPRTPFVDGLASEFVNPAKKGTKAASHYIFENVPGKGGCAVVRLKLTPWKPDQDPTLEDEVLFDDCMEERREEANEFYSALSGHDVSDDFKQIMRQALGGMLWTKQYYQFIQDQWINGDAAQPPPPPNRKYIRNRVSLLLNVILDDIYIHFQDWPHLHIADILSMPDKWVSLPSK